MFDKSGKGVFFPEKWEVTEARKELAKELRKNNTRTKGSKLFYDNYRRGISGTRTSKTKISANKVNLEINILALMRQNLIFIDGIPHATCVCTGIVMEVSNMHLDHIKEIKVCLEEGLSPEEMHCLDNIQFINANIHRNKKKIIKEL